MDDMNIGERMAKLEEKLDSHCQENNEHFTRIEKNQDIMNAKLDAAITSKADRKDLAAKADSVDVSNVKESVKELRNWVVGGILISILLMLISLLLRK